MIIKGVQSQRGCTTRDTRCGEEGQWPRGNSSRGVRLLLHLLPLDRVPRGNNIDRIKGEARETNNYHLILNGGGSSPLFAIYDQHTTRSSVRHHYPHHPWTDQEGRLWPREEKLLSITGKDRPSDALWPLCAKIASLSGILINFLVSLRPVLLRNLLLAPLSTSTELCVSVIQRTR